MQPGELQFDPEQPSPHGTRNKIGRLLWAFVYHGVFRWVPRPLGSVRWAILRLFGADVSFRSHVHPSVRIWAPWNLALEERACLGPEVLCYNVAPIRIGRDAVVSQRVHLCAASHDYTDPKMPVVSAPIVIEEGAWVAADAFVSMGVRIGRGAVIGARSVVTRDMPPDMVCVGHPCRPLKPRVAPPASTARPAGVEKGALERVE